MKIVYVIFATVISLVIAVNVSNRHDVKKKLCDLAGIQPGLTDVFAYSTSISPVDGVLLVGLTSEKEISPEDLSKNISTIVEDDIQIHQYAPKTYHLDSLIDVFCLYPPGYEAWKFYETKELTDSNAIVIGSWRNDLSFTAFILLADKKTVLYYEIW